MSEADPSSEFDRLSELTKHCIVHAAMVLAPRGGVKLPSGTHRIEQFCQEILGCINSSKKAKKKKQTAHLPLTSLIPEVEVLNFYEGVTSFEEFAIIVCSHILQVSSNVEDFDQTKIHKLCWECYSEYNKADIAYPKWFSNEDLLQLWLIFCSHLSSLSILLDVDIMNDIIKRITEKASFTWNESFSYEEQTPLDYITFLGTLVERFEKLQIDSTVISEIIVDLRDEIICGVLRKGYLFKKGHQVRNWKRRFFVLSRNSLTYYESREKMLLKGSLSINQHTNTEVLDDSKGERKHKFLVTCGNTRTEYIMCADDSRTRNEWLLDIGKAIQLEQALNRTTENEITNSIASFYQLKYGTSVPNLTRLDSTLRHATMGSSEFARMRIKQLSGTICVSSDIEGAIGGQNSSLPPGGYSLLKRPDMITDTSTTSNQSPQEDSTDQDIGGEEFYEEMTSGGDHVTSNDDSDDDNDDDAYTYMFQGKQGEGEEGGQEDREPSVKNKDIKSKSLERAIKLSLSVLEPDKEQDEKETEVSLNTTAPTTTNTDHDYHTINDEKKEDNYDGDLYEECDVTSPRYIPTPIHGDLEESHESNFQNMSGLLKVDLPSKSTSTNITSTSSLTSTHTSSDNYLPVLPGELAGNRNSTAMDSPPVPSPRLSLQGSPRKSTQRMSTEVTSSPTSPIRTTEPELYYITPPPVPVHRSNRRQS